MQPTTNLKTYCTPGATVETSRPGCWRMSIPAGPQGRYRCAQLDDYKGLARHDFPWQAPLEMSLRARVSAPNLPGTWGFGLWNDPFTASLGLGGMAARIPALPNTAWFFYASAPNHLALRDTHPAQGLLAATFNAPRIPGALLALGLPAAGLLAVPAAARWLRRLAARVIHEDAAEIEPVETEWRAHRLAWRGDSCQFWVDGRLALETPVSPRGRLGLVVWIDNQYAAFPPDGRLGYGALAGPSAWLEVEMLDINPA
jgi:hypothetical protein